MTGIHAGLALMFDMVEDDRVARVNLPNRRPDLMLAHLLGVALIGSISQIVTQTMLKGYACSKAVKIDAAALAFEWALSLIGRQTEPAAR